MKTGSGVLSTCTWRSSVDDTQAPIFCLISRILYSAYLDNANILLKCKYLFWVLIARALKRKCQ